MKLYAETPRRRTRQLVQDSVVAGWIVLWVFFGMVTHDVVARLAGPATRVAQSSESLSDSMASVSDTIDEVPLVGGALEEPFSSASRASASVAAESRAQKDLFLRAALWLGLFIALAPIGAVLLTYLPYRWRWVREATAADRLRLDSDDLYLFALRAIAKRPLSELRKASPDPGAALVSGDYEALARLELEQLGLRP